MTLVVFLTGAVFGVVLMGIITVAIIFLTGAPDYYQENVCKYLGGQVQGSVCIKDGRVISTKPLTTTPTPTTVSP